MQYYGDIYDKKWYRENDGDERFYALNPRYQEIIKLHDMLVANDIPHIIRRVFNGWQICYGGGGDPDENRIVSAIEHRGSYGQLDDKIEIMGLLTDEEKACDGVAGYLTAEDVYGRIHKHWMSLTRKVVV